MIKQKLTPQIWTKQQKENAKRWGWEGSRRTRDTFTHSSAVRLFISLARVACRVATVKWGIWERMMGVEKQG